MAEVTPAKVAWKGDIREGGGEVELTSSGLAGAGDQPDDPLLRDGGRPDEPRGADRGRTRRLLPRWHFRPWLTQAVTRPSHST